MSARRISYKQAIETARELLSDQIRDPAGEANPEYARGIVELIALSFGTAETTTQVMDDLRPRDDAWVDHLLTGKSA